MATSALPLILSTAVPQLFTLASQLATQAIQTGALTKDQVDAMWTNARGEWETALKEWQASVASAPPSNPA